jgi:hypothetical protein
MKQAMQMRCVATAYNYRLLQLLTAPLPKHHGWGCQMAELYCDTLLVYRATFLANASLMFLLH